MKNIYRIIDANLNRAREGLRVVEEICRFVLQDKRLTLTVKKLRGDLSRKMIKEQALKARRALADVGRKLYTEREGRRKNIKDIFQSNIKRAEEAVRVLEEFSKLIDPKSGMRFKKIRFKIYEVEKRISKKLPGYFGGLDRF